MITLISKPFARSVKEARLNLRIAKMLERGCADDQITAKLRVRPLQIARVRNRQWIEERADGR